MEGKKDDELARLIREWENVGGLNYYLPRPLIDMYQDDWGYVVDGDNPFYEDYMQAMPASRRQPVDDMRSEARRFYRTRLDRYEKQIFLVGRLKEIPRDLKIEFEERKADIANIGLTQWAEAEDPQNEQHLASLLGKPFHFKHCVLYPQMDGVRSEPDENDYAIHTPEEEGPVLTAIGTVYFVDSEQPSGQAITNEKGYGSDDIDPEEEAASENWDYWQEINF